MPKWVSWGYLGEEPIVDELAAASMEERGSCRIGKGKNAQSRRGGRAFREELAAVGEELGDGAEVVPRPDEIGRAHV